MSDIPMTPESVMNQILYCACPADQLPDGTRIFLIETHCVSWEIKAKLVSNITEEPNHKIISMERVAE